MIPNLSQETIAEYASDAQTIQEPQGTDYTQGVRVGKTIPAKWWNWLFRATTKRLGQAKTDAQNMLIELQNVVTDAGITLDSSVSTQLVQAVRAKTEHEVTTYIQSIKALGGKWSKFDRLKLSAYAYLNYLRIVCKLSDDSYFVTLLGNSSGYWYITKDFKHFNDTGIHYAVNDMTGDPSNDYTSHMGGVLLDNSLYMLQVIQYPQSSTAECELCKHTLGSSSYSIITSESTSFNYFGVIFIVRGVLHFLIFNSRGRYTLKVKNANDTFTTYTGTITGQHEYEAHAVYGVINNFVEAVALSGTKYLIGGYIYDYSDHSLTAVFSSKTENGTTAIAYVSKIDNTHYLVQPFRGSRCSYFCAIVATDGTVVEKNYYINVRLLRQLGSTVLIKSTHVYAEANEALLAFSLNGTSTFKSFPSSWPVFNGNSTATRAGNVRNIFALNGHYYTSVYFAYDSAWHLYKSSVISSNSADYEQVTPKAFAGSVYALNAGTGLVCPASAELSEDLGLTWSKGHLLPEGTDFCCDIETNALGRMLADGPSVLPNAFINCYTESEINRVIGHTLYLK